MNRTKKHSSCVSREMKANSGVKQEGHGQKHAVLSEKELAEFRTILCIKHSLGSEHEADCCPHSHCLTWQRRNPTDYSYSSTLCPDIEFVRKGNKMKLVRRCSKGRMCSYAHSKEEELYHPAVYKTRLCNAYPRCQRFYCPFVHDPHERRHLTWRLEDSTACGTKSGSSVSLCEGADGAELAAMFDDQSGEDAKQHIYSLEPQSVLEQLIFLPTLCSGRPLQPSELRYLVSFIQALQNCPINGDVSSSDCEYKSLGGSTSKWRVSEGLCPDWSFHKESAERHNPMYCKLSWLDLGYVSDSKY